MMYQEGTPTSQKIPFDEIIKEYENNWWAAHTKHEHYMRFEHTIRVLPSTLSEYNTASNCLKNNNINMENFLLDYAHFNLNLYSFFVKDEMNETNEIFNQNSKDDIERFLELCDKLFDKSQEGSFLFIRKYIKAYIYKENL